MLSYCFCRVTKETKGAAECSGSYGEGRLSSEEMSPLAAIGVNFFLDIWYSKCLSGFLKTFLTYFTFMIAFTNCALGMCHIVKYILISCSNV